MVFSFKINEFIKGRGLWKFNNSLLHDTDYVKEIKNLISIVKEQYAVKIYRDENLQNIDNSEIEFTVDDQLFLETLLTEIRGKTISYASYKKKAGIKIENEIISKLKQLEENALTVENLEEIDQKKAELKMYRQKKVQGQYVRSRSQWIEEGEKPTNFFFNLETRNYINKTIQKLTLENGVIVEEQKEILNQTKVFYEKH